MALQKPTTPCMSLCHSMLQRCTVRAHKSDSRRELQTARGLAMRIARRYNDLHSWSGCCVSISARDDGAQGSKGSGVQHVGHMNWQGRFIHRRVDDGQAVFSFPGDTVMLLMRRRTCVASKEDCQRIMQQMYEHRDEVDARAAQRQRQIRAATEVSSSVRERLAGQRWR